MTGASVLPSAVPAASGPPRTAGAVRWQVFGLVGADLAWIELVELDPYWPSLPRAPRTDASAV